MRIRKKLIIAFTVPLLLIGTISLLGYIWSRVLFIKATDINGNKVKLALTIEAVNSHLAYNSILYLLLPNPEQRKQFNDLLQFQQEQINEYKKLPITAYERNYLNQLQISLNQSTIISKEIFELSDRKFNDLITNRTLLYQQIRPQLANWIASLKGNDTLSFQKKFVLAQLSASINTFIAVARFNMIIYDKPSIRETHDYIEKTKSLYNILGNLNLNSQELIWYSQLKSEGDQLISSVLKILEYVDKKNHLLYQSINLDKKIDYILNRKLFVFVQNKTDEIQNLIKDINYILIILIVLLTLLGIMASWLFARHLMKPIDTLRSAISQLKSGKDVTIHRTTQDEMGDLSEAFSDLVIKNKENSKVMSDQNWLKQNISEILTLVQNELTLETMCNAVLTKIAELLNAGFGAFYITHLKNDTKYLILTGSYGYTKRKHISNRFKYGESLVGQTALEGKTIILTEVPEDYIHITSGLGNKSPTSIILLPLIFETKTLGVLELAFFKEISTIEKEFLEQISPNLAVTIETIQNREITEKALLQVKQQSEKLQIQQEELRTTNEELEEKTQSLLQSEEELKTQSEELQATNEELEEKMQAIEIQKKEIENKNQTLKKTQIDLEEKAKSLARSGKYKSEFLSNMSHELRTPLNSLLLLSKSFADNEDGNLTQRQIEEANIIYKGGKDLLELINDILDLSKVEAGKLNIHIEDTLIQTLLDDLTRQFNGIVKNKSLTFETKIVGNITAIKTDPMRLKQILTNLIANAVKFTPEGTVTLLVSTTEESVIFKVIDTGVGIEKEKQEEIFEAFQQAYGNTDRIYGGTGLGLTISRELTHLLGGEINVESAPGKGSTFTVILPMKAPSQKRQAPEIPSKKHSSIDKQVNLASKNKINQQGATILLIEDDSIFITLLEKFAADKGYTSLKALNGTNGLALAEQYIPDGIILDLGLPDISGIEVIEKLKENPKTKDIPIHIISASDKSVLPEQFSGITFISKPADKNALEELFNFISKNKLGKTIRVLFINSDLEEFEKIKSATHDKKIDFITAITGQDALTHLKNNQFDGVILDLSLPDIDGLALLKQISATGKNLPPIIIYSSRNLTEKEYAELSVFTKNIVKKNGSNSLERLLHECSLFLYAVNKKIPISQRAEKQMVFESDKVLHGKKALLVDDDMRNVYALSKLLRNQGMLITPAINGQDALNKLADNFLPDIIIMDIMMPVMDGYETIKHIRKQSIYKQVPIIAVTAKAMPEDRNACLEAGANDYLVKPVEGEKLLGMLRIWLSK